MNRGKRYAAIVLLGEINTSLVHDHSALFRLVKMNCPDALTDGEKEFILKRRDAIDKAQRELTSLGVRMKTKYNQNV